MLLCLGENSVFKYYPTALLFAQEVYFDNRLTGEA